MMLFTRNELNHCWKYQARVIECSMHVIILQVHYELIRSIDLHCPTHGGRRGED